MSIRLLLIGYGAIGGYVFRNLADNPRLESIHLLVRPGREVAARHKLGDSVNLIHSINELPEKPNLALECAGHGALEEFGAPILSSGVPLGVVSVGALADLELYQSLRAKAQLGGTSMTILSGAIGAVDALSAARRGGLSEVIYTGCKPPQAWAGTPAEDFCDLAELEMATTLFRGSAGEAARLYPKNANVAATIGLAGIGMEQTQVRLVADPSAKGNRHHIAAQGAFGTFEFTILGNPLPESPRSSALTAMSAVRFVENHVNEIRL